MFEELLRLARTPEEQKFAYKLVGRMRAADPAFGQAVGAVKGIAPPPRAPEGVGTLEAIAAIVAELERLTLVMQRQRRPIRITFTRDSEGRIIEATPEYSDG